MRRVLLRHRTRACSSIAPLLGVAIGFHSALKGYLTLCMWGFDIDPLYTLRYFASQAAEFKYDNEEPESEHIPAVYIHWFEVAMRAE